MSRKPYKQFHHGKGVKKTPFLHKPMKWLPWSYIDSYNIQNGRFRSRRKFGSDGWAYMDLDTPDDHKPYDHVHDIQKGKRAPDRKPNKQERKELEKAKKKRRFL